MHVASYRGYPSVVESLVKLNADVNICARCIFCLLFGCLSVISISKLIIIRGGEGCGSGTPLDMAGAQGGDEEGVIAALKAAGARCAISFFLICMNLCRMLQVQS